MELNTNTTGVEQGRLPCCEPRTSVRADFQTSATLAAMVALTAVLTACNKPPATDGQDVLDYVRNGAAGAHVRRLDNVEQKYVDAIFKPYEAWKKANAPIDKIADLDALWEKDSNDWRDADKLASTISSIFAWSVDAKPDGSKEKDEKKKPKRRSEYAVALRTAIANVPASLEAMGDELVARIPQLLSPKWDGFDPAVQRYQRVSSAYLQLLAYVLEHSAQFDPSAKGLAFTTSEVTDEALKRWSSLHAMLAQERAAVLSEYESLLTDGKARREEISTDKQALKKGEDSSENVQRQIRALDLLGLHYDARIKAAEKRLRKIKRHQEDKEKEQEERDKARANQTEPRP